jgi:membrane protein
VGGFLAAVSFNVARALFTRIVAGSSITFIYGAFAAVPLFLLWVYISWTIVLVGAIVTHSLSAYQSDARARRPLVLKALELLHLLWRRQADGKGLRELELLTDRNHTLDAESWQHLRDRLTDVRLLARDEDGAYRLARDLHEVTLWQLQDWLHNEGRVTAQTARAMEPWEQAATERLLASQRNRRRELTIRLTDLFNDRAKGEAEGAADQSALRRVYANEVSRT